MNGAREGGGLALGFATVRPNFRSGLATPGIGADPNPETGVACAGSHRSDRGRFKKISVTSHLLRCGSLEWDIGGRFCLLGILESLSPGGGHWLRLLRCLGKELRRLLVAEEKCLRTQREIKRETINRNVCSGGLCVLF